jgi:hypothetical protein
MLDEHVNHLYRMLYRATEKTDAAERPVYCSPFSLHIPINAQEGKAMTVLDSEDSLRLG